MDTLGSVRSRLTQSDSSSTPFPILRPRNKIPSCTSPNSHRCHSMAIFADIMRYAHHYADNVLRSSTSSRRQCRMSSAVFRCQRKMWYTLVREVNSGGCTMKLHDRLKEVRKHRGLTLLQVKDSTGLSVSYLSDLERGRTNNPTVETLEKLARCYGVNLPDLLAGVEGQGHVTVESLPPGLKDLVAASEVDPEWARDLARLEFRGKRPQTKDEWREIYYYMRRMMKPYLDE